MTERLYYHDSFLTEFEARGVRLTPRGAVLDRTAFYPTRGGPPHDTGVLEGGPVSDVFEDEEGDVVHALAGPVEANALVHGRIDWARRADHIQQHTGQHLLSAVFVRLFNLTTVSFHLGVETSTIDLATPAISPAQARQAEELANQVIFEDRPLRVFVASAEEARLLPLRKESTREGPLRLVEIPGLDLSACGGTHAARTGQIGGLLVRKIEKSRDGARVEFVCGGRAVRQAGMDFAALGEAAALLTTHPHQVAAMARRQAEELKASEKERQKLLQSQAAYEARDLYAATPETGGIRELVRIFDAADPGYVRSLAAQFAAQPGARALFAVRQPPTLVLAQSRGLPADLGALVKAAAGEFGLRGGGSRDSAQAGAPDASAAERALEAIRAQLG